MNMQWSERDELKRAIKRFQELASPQSLLALLTRIEELEAEKNREEKQWTQDQEQARLN